MLRSIYLDNAATTQALPSVAKVMQEALVVAYGNPSSVHSLGMQAEELVRRARRNLAQYMGVPERGLVFTSGGTEADNLAVLGVARSYMRRGRHVVISAIEHSAVIGAAKALQNEGWEISTVGVDTQGIVDPAAVAAAVRNDTVLVSVMTVNNEIGSIQPLAALARAVQQKNNRTLIHTDAVQALGKVDLDPVRWGIDLVSVSAHKVHGPKGCGALWVREGVRVEPMVYGGGQERGIRSGTENVAGIAGFGAAIEALGETGLTARVHLAELRAKLIAQAQALMPQLVVNGPDAQNAAPHIVNVSIPGLRGEVMVHALAQEGVFVSTGAACSSHHRDQANHVLKAIGATESVSTGSLRFSLSPTTTIADIDTAVAALTRVVDVLSGTSGTRRL